MPDFDRVCAAVRTIVALLFCLILSWLAAPPVSAAARVTTPHTQVELLAETDGVTAGQTLWVALRLKLAPGWHTYWKNPGDSGEPAHLDWTLPKGMRAGAVQWPAPQAFRLDPFVTFGYEGEPWLLTPITVPPTAAPGDRMPIALSASWLACADICVPEDADLTLELPVLKAAPPANQWAADGFRKARAALPVALKEPVSISVSGNRATLSLSDAALSSVRKAYFFPEPQRLLRIHAPQTVKVRGDHLMLTTELAPDARGANAPSALAKLTGVLVTTTADGVQNAYAVTSTRYDAEGSQTTPGAASSLSLGLAFVFAFLGGALLNLMPCVFPVLSMKALALMRDRDAHHARLEGLAYGAGVVVSFLGLAGLLLILRAGGMAIGWGFQLQSPLVVGALALLFAAIGLNLLGVFELRGPAFNAAQTRPSLIQDFLMGILAVVVASPCTAPFMAAALGLALTLPPLTALLIFAALGIGMAAPYLAVTSVPALRRHVPKPGPWMTLLREALAFPMFGGAVWLAWVLSRETGPGGVGLLGIGLVSLGLAAWSWGRVQTIAARKVLTGVAMIAIAVTGASLVALARMDPALTTHAKTAHDGEVFSAERLSELQDAGRPVLVNATAAWCITCQWNEARVLSSQPVQDALRTHGVTVLIADWTRRSPEITALLAAYGRSGVPLYLLFEPGQSKARVLPQVLTNELVLDAIRTLPPVTQSAAKL